MTDQNIYHELVTGILMALPAQVVRIILYGSVARGTDTPESDVDIAVLTKIKIDKKTRSKLTKASWDLGMELDVLFSVVTIEINHFNEWLFVLPFYFNIDEEGIILWKHEAA